MSDKLAKMREKLLAKENPTPRSNSNESGFFPFFNTPENGTTVLRFLPDGDPTNDFFWREKLHINLTFNGIKGQSNEQVTVRVPCMEMYNEACPILNEIRPWWKDPEDAETARKYWKKRSYLFQGFVIDTQVEETTPENPIRKFSISPGIYDKIKTAITEPDYEDLPTDYVNGRNFRLKKTRKGGFANYDNSSWAPREEALSSVHLEAIDKYGLNNLNDMLPKKPTPAEVEIIFSMFRDSLDEQAYDPEKYSQFYRPYGVSVSGSSKTTVSNDAVLSRVKAQTRSEPVVEDVEDTSSNSSTDVASILARVHASRSK